ncbi:hypothetical protein FHS19_000453 [Paenibacillus rhizosphaerae]|uniref:Uncharacterized protein n=1 Tax=Paenibacillus rhizosphaerae TaxID=297318 RepID=A0A839TKA5_9BACL|nr:hypothetical protein [Paenibacillus rhizosphaerae]MBB3125799.1 hypothetical protein [Paenibacillus rhizosphaerae]
MRKTEQLLIKRTLEQELSEIRFTQAEEVLRATHPRSWRDRVRAFLNKELELPLVPLGTAPLFLMAALFVYHLAEQPKTHPGGPQLHRELIEEGGSYYWKDEYERKVNGHEGDHQS